MTDWKTHRASRPPGRGRRRGLRVHQDLFAELGASTHQLFWVSDYRSAIEASRRDGYDVCLVDYRLGGGEDGVDLARQLIADGHRMPVILLTGQNDREVDEKAARAGAADFLVKGQVSAATLERTIRYAIQSHAALLALQDSYRTTVRALAAALELRDDQTGAQPHASPNSPSSHRAGRAGTRSRSRTRVRLPAPRHRQDRRPRRGRTQTRTTRPRRAAADAQPRHPRPADPRPDPLPQRARRATSSQRTTNAGTAAATHKDFAETRFLS